MPVLYMQPLHPWCRQTCLENHLVNSSAVSCAWCMKRDTTPSEFVWRLIGVCMISDLYILNFSFIVCPLDPMVYYLWFIYYMLDFAAVGGKTNYFNVFLSVDPCSQSYFFCWSTWSWLQQIQKSLSQFDPCSWCYSNCALHNDSHWHHGKKYCEIQFLFSDSAVLNKCVHVSFLMEKAQLRIFAERDSRTAVQAVNFISFLQFFQAELLLMQRGKRKKKIIFKSFLLFIAWI